MNQIKYIGVHLNKIIIDDRTLYYLATKYSQTSLSLNYFFVGWHQNILSFWTRKTSFVYFVKFICTNNQHPIYLFQALCKFPILQVELQLCNCQVKVDLPQVLIYELASNVYDNFFKIKLIKCNWFIPL